MQSVAQLEAAGSFLESTGEQPVEWQKLEETAGIGVVVRLSLQSFHPVQFTHLHAACISAALCTVQVTDEQITAAVADVVNANKDFLLAER